jgi:probable DNA metabolism protein
MNKIYVYDGSFLSLINLIIYLIDKNIKPDSIREEDYNPNLFEEIINLDIGNNITIDKFFEMFGSNVFSVIYYVFLSSDENKELILFYFCLNARKYKSSILYRRNLKCVSEALRISEYVSHETHKFKGFVRFKELENNVLYAEIEPVNNVLFLISKHFAKRLKSEYWIIKDVKRNILSIYDKKEFIIVSDDEFVLATDKVSDKENLMVDLWKVFYKTIGISERKNDRCRMNFMPKRYWKYLTEMSDEL